MSGQFEAKTNIGGGGFASYWMQKAEREPDPTRIPFHAFRSANALAFWSPHLLLVFFKPEITSLNFHSSLLLSVLLEDEDVHAVEEDEREIVIGNRVNHLNLQYIATRQIVHTFMKPMM